MPSASVHGGRSDLVTRNRALESIVGSRYRRDAHDGTHGLWPPAIGSRRAREAKTTGEGSVEDCWNGRGLGVWAGEGGGPQVRCLPGCAVYEGSSGDPMAAVLAAYKSFFELPPHAAAVQIAPSPAVCRAGPVLYIACSLGLRFLAPPSLQPPLPPRAPVAIRTPQLAAPVPFILFPIPWPQDCWLNLRRDRGERRLRLIDLIEPPHLTFGCCC